MIIGYVVSSSSSVSFDIALNPEARVRLYDYVAVEGDMGKVIGQITRIYSQAYMANIPPLFSVVEEASKNSREVRRAVAKALGPEDALKEPLRAGSPVRLASDEEIEALYGRGDLCVGHLSARRSVDICLNLDDVNRHMAVIAKTGSGKTWFAVVLIEELLKQGGQIFVFDTHGEYVSTAKTAAERMGARSVVLALYPRHLERDVRSTLYKIGVLDMDPDDLADAADVPANATVIREVLYLAHSLARKVREKTGRGIALEGLMRIIDAAIKDKGDKAYRGKGELRRLLDEWGAGDLNEAQELLDFVERKKAESIYDAKRYLRSLSRLGIFADKGTQLSELDADLVVFNLVGVGGKLFDYVSWHLLDRIFTARVRAERDGPGERLERPVVVVLEEAQRFAPPKAVDRTRSYSAVARIATEGRKFGVYLAVVTQRPYRVDQDVMSQMGTQVLMRITNAVDQKAVADASEDLTQDYLEGLSGLATGEAIIMGKAMKIPVVIRVRDRVLDYGGGDISLKKAWGKWRRVDDAYKDVVPHWRRLFGEFPPQSLALEAAHMGVEHIRNEGDVWHVAVMDEGKRDVALSLERRYVRCSCGKERCPHIYKALELIVRRSGARQIQKS